VLSLYIGCLRIDVVGIISGLLDTAIRQIDGMSICGRRWDLFVSGMCVCVCVCVCVMRGHDGCKVLLMSAAGGD
jgi:hypothetical protein